MRAQGLEQMGAQQRVQELGAPQRVQEVPALADRKSTRLNSSHLTGSRMPSSA